MNKILRYSLLAVLTLVSSMTFAQEATVTLDFSNNNVWNFPTKKTVATASYTNGTYTVKLTGSDKAGYNFTKGSSCLLLGKKDAMLELPAFDFDVERIDVVGHDQASGYVTQNIFVGGKAVSTPTTGAKKANVYEIAAASQAAGNIYILKVTNDNNTQIKKILIWKKGATPTPTQIENIAACKKLPSGTIIQLTLKDAKVQYANGSDIYVVDATGGIDLFKTGLNYTAGQVLNGTITATYELFNNLPELTTVKENNLLATEGTVTPIEMTVEEAAKAEHACKLVTLKKIKAVKIEETSNGKTYTNYYTDNNKIIQIYDKFKLNYIVNAEKEMDYTGIIIPYNKKIELAPTMKPTVSTGINNVENATTDKDGAIYNLAGQRVDKNYKGVVIKNGQKYIQR